ncbi:MULTISPECIES: acyltransferase family protein [unclassified Mesorhizobium]|uniref:acyltransferase family protein n=1 Tax=unclassified Mesorhizobium TaxID=325217 RepID=UPI001CC98174|nr:MULTISPECIES: acyltransferase [unclassified Mesorhizobium]MBZ9742491.1 acyltransferase [Mesorhizobium sp. CO1-1-4]MBZ9801030.1 acyltransferase [Mesorhizobium sp. ES1-6]
MNDIHSIQYLRGLAAFAVVFFHISEQFGGPFRVGAAGVDLFFVISGFIMWVTTVNRPVDPQRFMWRRIVRIVPLYWIVTLLTALAIFLKPQFLFGHVLSPTNFVGSLLFLPVLQDGSLHPVVIQGWTLCYEMMFYVIFALALLLGEKLRFAALIGVLSLIVVLNLLLLKGYPEAFTSPIVLEFAAGVVVGRLWMKDVRLQLVLALSLVAGGLLLLVAAQMLDPEMPRVLRWGIPATLVVAGAVFAERAKPFRPMALFTFFGNASYSIYIWHVLVVVAVTGITLRLGVPPGWQPATIAIVSIALCAMLYLVIEKPLTRFLNPSRARSLPPPETRA